MHQRAAVMGERTVCMVGVNEVTLSGTVVLQMADCVEIYSSFPATRNSLALVGQTYCYFLLIQGL